VQRLGFRVLGLVLRVEESGDNVTMHSCEGRQVAGVTEPPRLMPIPCLLEYDLPFPYPPDLHPGPDPFVPSPSPRCQPPSPRYHPSSPRYQPPAVCCDSLSPFTSSLPLVPPPPFMTVCP